MTCSCKEAKTVTHSTCHPCSWWGSCKTMNPSKDLHLTPQNLLSKSLRKKSLFTLLWSILHLGKSHSCGSQGNFVLALRITSSLKTSPVGVENTPVTLICQNNLFYQATALKQRGSLRKKGALSGCGYILITPKEHRILPTEVHLFQWEQKYPNIRIIDSTLIFLISFRIVRSTNIIGEKLPLIRTVNTDATC